VVNDGDSRFWKPVTKIKFEAKKSCKKVVFEHFTGEEPYTGVKSMQTMHPSSTLSFIIL
jgi:hypothetical protein